MAERLFLFVQFEFPWELGPPDGRYLLRRPGSEEPEHVVVLSTVAAAPRAPKGVLSRRARRGAVRAQPTPEPAELALARATIIDPISLPAERQAQAWLDDFDSERDLEAACAVLNRVLYLHRIACADCSVHEIDPSQAVVIRAGWGEGEQVAGGQWRFARELSSDRAGGRARRWPGGRRYSAALRSSERFALLLGGRAQPLVCEELTLRARLDLDQQRLRHAAIELRNAYTVALVELREASRQDLLPRIAELESLAKGVLAQEQAALGGEADELDSDVLRHGLERLEAALRARTAGALG